MHPIASRVLVTLSLATCLLLAVPVAAKPPAVEDFVRIDEFNRQLADKLQQLREAEEFEKKPFPEQLMIKWEKGAATFKHVRKINGPDVLDAIFDWDELAQEPVTDATKRIMKRLPEVLKYKYGDVVKMSSTFRRDRYKVGKVLVDQLVKPPLHVRELAINCLEEIHKTRRQYVAEDPKEKRIKRQKAWKAYIDRVRKYGFFCSSRSAARQPGGRTIPGPRTALRPRRPSAGSTVSRSRTASSRASCGPAMR